jgi:hypothetical protein
MAAIVGVVVVAVILAVLLVVVVLRRRKNGGKVAAAGDEEHELALVEGSESRAGSSRDQTASKDSRQRHSKVRHWRLSPDSLARLAGLFFLPFLKSLRDMKPANMALADIPPLYSRVFYRGRQARQMYAQRGTLPLKQMGMSKRRA